MSKSKRNNSDDKCAICMESLNKLTDNGNSMPIIKLPCNHSYHKICYAQLMIHKGLPKCPVCRADLPENKIGKIKGEIKNELKEAARTSPAAREHIRQRVSPSGGRGFSWGLNPQEMEETMRGTRRLVTGPRPHEPYTSTPQHAILLERYQLEAEEKAKAEADAEAEEKAKADAEAERLNSEARSKAWSETLAAFSGRGGHIRTRKSKTRKSTRRRKRRQTKLNYSK